MAQLDSEAYKTLFPVEYHDCFFKQQVRPDGRSLNEIRKVSISKGTITCANGSAFVLIGDTSVICGIRAEVGPVKIEQSDVSDRMIINVDLGSLDSARRKVKLKPQKIHEESAAFSVRIAKMLQRAGSLFDREQLKFDAESKYSWYLYCDIEVISNNGSLYDAMVLSLISALSNVSLQHGGFDKDGNPFIPENEPNYHLTLKHWPVATSFVLFKDYLLIDPTFAEESLTDCSMISVVVDSANEGTVFEIAKQSGGSIDAQIILTECMKRAVQRAIEVRQLMEK